MPRKNRVDKSRARVSCQGQYLVKLECDFSWQAQHFVQFWEIAGVKMLYFFIQNASPRWDESRRVRDDDFMLGCPRNVLESSLYWRKQFRDFLLILNSEFRGKGSTW